MSSGSESMSDIDKIISAITDNDWERFHKAVMNTKDLDVRAQSWWTPLTFAAFSGRMRMVKELIHRGALVNYADTEGDTSVFNAARGGHTDVVRVLVESKADAHKPNNSGITPLHMAACYGHMAIVKYLVEECHTDINTKDDGDASPIEYARFNKNHVIAQYLEQQIVLQVIMKHINMFPFYKDVAKIIVQYLPFPQVK